MQMDIAARLCYPDDRGQDSSELQASVRTNERIRDWLDQVRAFCHGPPDAQDEQSTETSPTHAKQPWRPHGLPIAEIDAKIRQDRRRRDEEPTKLDMLLSVSSSTSDVTTAPSSSLAGRPSPGGKRRRRRSPSQTASTLDRSEYLVFEKRPRRKTRTDKYDTNKRRGHKDVVKRKQASRPSKKMKRGKSGLKSGHDIMNSFVSPAITNPRLTTKPNLRTGLFLNGRSSKSRRLTDLSFNDMEFFDDDHDDDTKKETPNSRLRDHRRREQELQADADFFEDATGRHLTTSSSQEAEKMPEPAKRDAPSKELADKINKSRPPHKDDEEAEAGRVYPDTPARNTSTPVSKRPDTPEVQSTESRPVTSPGKRLLQESDKEDETIITEEQTEHITNTEFFAEALRQTGVFDFPRLTRGPISVLSQTQDLAPRKLPGLPTAEVESRRRDSTIKAYRDIGIMVGQPFDSCQGAQSQDWSGIYDSDVVEHGQGSHGEINLSETGAKGTENENMMYARLGSKAERSGEKNISRPRAVASGQEPEAQTGFFDEHFLDQDSPFDGYPGDRPVVPPSRCSSRGSPSSNPPWTFYYTPEKQMRPPNEIPGLFGGNSMYDRLLVHRLSLQPSQDHYPESLLGFIERTEREVLGKNASIRADDDYQNKEDGGCVCVGQHDQFQDTNGWEETTDLYHPYGSLNISAPVFRAINTPQGPQWTKEPEAGFQNQPVAGRDEVYESDGLVMADFWRPNFL